jgi:uncharacterized membrane protein YphA (DoxX/SURF4 family)
MTASPSWPRRIAHIALWLLSGVTALGIGGAGLTKFIQSANWTHLFTTWGYPAWVSPLIGAVEISAAIALLITPLALYGAAVLAVVMVVALTTLLTHPGGPMGWGMTPVIYLVMLAVIVGGRRALTRAAKPTRGLAST